MTSNRPHDAEQELEEFLYIVSHDLNAPIRHVREFSKLLVTKLEGRLSDQEQQYAEFLQNGVLQIESMLAALLSYSRLGTLTDSVTEFQSAQLLQQIKHVLPTPVELNESGDVVIRGCKPQIYELFLAVIDNAIKFSDPDNVIVGVHAERTDSGCRFIIRDQGLGIPSGAKDKIFKLFKQGAPKTEGVGLGLALAEKICRMHDGCIWVESSEPGDTQIVFELRDQKVD